MISPGAEVDKRGYEGECVVNSAIVFFFGGAPNELARCFGLLCFPFAFVAALEQCQRSTETTATSGKMSN